MIDNEGKVVMMVELALLLESFIFFTPLFKKDL